jgi:hypothetical protein
MRYQKNRAFTAVEHCIKMGPALDLGDRPFDEILIQTLVEKAVHEMLIASHEIVPHELLQGGFGELIAPDCLDAFADMAGEPISTHPSMECPQTARDSQRLPPGKTAHKPSQRIEEGEQE